MLLLPVLYTVMHILLLATIEQQCSQSPSMFKSQKCKVSAKQFFLTFGIFAKSCKNTRHFQVFQKSGYTVYFALAYHVADYAGYMSAC